MKTRIVVVGFVLIAVLWILIARSLDGSPNDEKGGGDSQATVTDAPGFDGESYKRFAGSDQMGELIRGFVTAYFDRDKSFVVGSTDDRAERFNARLEPFTTEDFRATNARPPDIPQEEAFLEAGGRVMVVVRSIDIATAQDAPQESVIVRQTTVDPQGEKTFYDFTIRVSFVLISDEWLVQTVNLQPS